MEIKIHDNIIHYDVVHPQGSANLLILHGWGHSGSMWQPVAELLPDVYRCYLVDLPGFGHSPLGDVSTLSDYADMVAEFTTKLNLTMFSLLGHSFGGQVAVKVAGNSDIKSLILVAPAIKRERSSLANSWYSMLAIMAKVKKWLPASWTYHLSSGTNYSEATPKLKMIFRNLIGTDVTADLENIHCPTLGIWGERDREILGSAKELVGMFPKGKLKVIYNAGHNLHLENPNELARIIERYV